jgi:hypothetical protein
MFWHKKLTPPVEADKEKSNSYLTFFITENDDLKVEFGFENISEMIVLSDAVLNGKVRNLSINTIYNKIFEGGLIAEASEFACKINKSIKPSEYQP